MRWWLFLILAFHPISAQADSQASLVALEQRLSAVSWHLAIDAEIEPACQEHYAFTPEGILFITSGAERLATQWQVRPIEDSDVVSLHLDHLSSNGAPDCLGNRTPLGGPPYVRYLQDTGEGGVRLCWRESKSSCFATVIPAAPEPTI